MHYQKNDPPAALRSRVTGFWYLCLDFAHLPNGFEVLQDGYVEIMFHFGSPCYLATPTGWHRLPSPFRMGLLQAPVRLHARGPVTFLSAQCFPWAVSELWGLPAAPAGAGRVSQPLAQLHASLAQLMQAGQVAEAFAQLTQYLLARLGSVSSDQLLSLAGAAMHAAHGTLPIREVAAAAHATLRTLERQFKHATGYSVKNVSGLMRFAQVRNHLWVQPATSLAGLAHEMGYADQAHLSREFKRYSGTTPASFARTHASGSPAAGPDFVAFVQA